MKITAFILLLVLSLVIATESKMSDGDKQGRNNKGNHGKDRNRGRGYDKDGESSAVADADSPPASGQFIRLAGDDDFPRKYFEGRVEVYLGEKWGIVCDDNWDIEDAHVACRQLGFISGAQEAVQLAGFGTGSWDNISILMDEVSCQGNEATISECSRQLQHDCTEQEAAGVRCVENSGCLDGWIAGPSGCYKLSSETVNTRDLAVDKCAENGGHLLTIATESENNFISNVLYALGDKEFSGSVLTGGMRSENVWFWQKVTQSFSPPADEDFSFIYPDYSDLYSYDNGDYVRSKRIKRASKGKGRTMQGGNSRMEYSEMIERTSSTSIPYFNWFPGWMPQHVGAEPSNMKYDECIFLEKDYEFINGSKLDVGYYFWKDEHCNTTTTFMPNGFHYMCEVEKEQLRVPGGSISWKSKGKGSMIEEKQLRGPVETVNVQLTGGRTKYEGNVVVTKDGRPGYICDDEWDDKDASVVCRMLGFQGGKAYSGRHFRVMGIVSGIILDNVQCTGSEPSLSQCLHEPWGQHDCTNSEYAGVACLNPEEQECGKRPLMERLHSTRNEYELEQIAPSPDSERIIGGMNADPGANPWQAGVRLVKYAQHWCGGTILSEYWILSAAHCFREYRQDDIVVRTGDHNNLVYDDHEQEFKIDVLITHERYGAGMKLDYDIALIKIRPQDGRGIVFNDYVQPACLPVSNTEYKAGMKCHISGWGETSYGDPNILQTAVVPIISESVCNLSYIGMLTPRMFCAGYLSGGVDTCYGDSGGPLVCNIQGKYTVMGITSWGAGCAKPNAPGVYAKVKEFLPWIKQKMQLY